MNGSRKKWFIVAGILVIVGAILFLGALAAIKFDFKKLNTREFQMKTYEVTEEFENISINVETATVTFVPSEEGVCKVECLEEKKQPHSVIAQENTLKINAIDKYKWYHYIGINFQLPQITVYLPQKEYASLTVTTKTGNINIPAGYRFEKAKITGTTANICCEASVSENVEIKTTTGKILLSSTKTQTVKLSAATGKIEVDDVVCDQLTVKTTTGKIEADDVACNQLTATSTTGKITLDDVIAEQSIRVENTTGGVEFEECDGAEIFVKTTTGNVKGTLLSGKTFLTSTSTGKVSVPQTSSGGRCEIKTSTGNIKIEIE